MRAPHSSWSRSRPSEHPVYTHHMLTWLASEPFALRMDRVIHRKNTLFRRSVNDSATNLWPSQQSSHPLIDPLCLASPGRRRDPLGIPCPTHSSDDATTTIGSVPLHPRQGRQSHTFSSVRKVVGVPPATKRGSSPGEGGRSGCRGGG